VPNHELFIGLLIVFEAAAGALVLVEGRVRQVALALLIGFNIALVSFGWGYLLWSVPMVAALSLLRRADRVWWRTSHSADVNVTISGAAP
jgi:hypothetical protein